MVEERAKGASVDWPKYKDERAYSGGSKLAKAAVEFGPEPGQGPDHESLYLMRSSMTHLEGPTIPSR